MTPSKMAGSQDSFKRERKEECPVAQCRDQEEWAASYDNIKSNNGRSREPSRWVMRANVECDGTLYRRGPEHGSG